MKLIFAKFSVQPTLLNKLISKMHLKLRLTSAETGSKIILKTSSNSESAIQSPY